MNNFILQKHSTQVGLPACLYCHPKFELRFPFAATTGDSTAMVNYLVLPKRASIHCKQKLSRFLSMLPRFKRLQLFVQVTIITVNEISCLQQQTISILDSWVWPWVRYTLSIVININVNTIIMSLTSYTTHVVLINKFNTSSQQPTIKPRCLP